METDNILIAKFMGEKLPYINNQGRFEYMVEGAGLISSTNVEDLYRFLRYNYNTDWNRLMQVVEKIENLHEANNVLIGTNLTYIQIHNKATNEQETFKGVEQTKIGAVYNACIEFIKWYNENSAKEK